MNILKGLEPQSVLKYFEEISQIPRGSGNEKGISDFLVNFGKNLGLETIQDESLNVIIRKPATPGYENAPGVIIQGHMDMVCEKNKDTIHDFEKDPIKLRVDGDYIYATGTTLGADNGIAVAYGMAVLASNDIAHPAIELLVTTDEEVGMGGAIALDGTLLKGKYLLNIDSEEEGKLLVSCAGGARSEVTLPINFEDMEKDFEVYEIMLRGLKGGHSGMEIDKQRGNSNKLMGRVLNDINANCDIRLISINGGSKVNAIPRECDTLLAVKKEDIKKLEELIQKWDSILKDEYHANDSGVNVTLVKKEENHKVFSKDTTFKAIKIMNLIPDGVDTYSIEMKGLVQSSTNLGVVTTEEDKIIFASSTRSSVETLKTKLLDEIADVAEVLGGEFEIQAPYPAWQYNPDSKIRELCSNVYKNMTGKDPEIIAIHAGLECGLLGEKIEGLDMISFGPNMYDVHTPNEHVSISSVKNIWDFLVEILKAIK